MEQAKQSRSGSLRGSSFAASYLMTGAFSGWVIDKEDQLKVEEEEEEESGKVLTTMSQDYIWKWEKYRINVFAVSHSEFINL